MPGLNELMDARMVTSKGAKSSFQWNKYSDVKRKWASQIKILAWHRRFEVVERGYFTYLFVEPNRGRDKSNVIAGGIKLIEDALVEAKILRNDGWAVVQDIRPYVEARDFAGALVVIDENRVFEREEMIELMEKEHGTEKKEKRERVGALRDVKVRGADRKSAE